jgi:hypothetical protein
MPPVRDGAARDPEVQRLCTCILGSVARLTECLRLMRQAMALQAETRRQLHRLSWPHGDLSDTGALADLADLADADATTGEDAAPSGPAIVTNVPGAAVLVGVIVRGPWPDSGSP